jgi:hypothetical protein
MTDVNLDDMIRKIKALHAKANDSSLTEEEASAFSAKVAELLDAYNLSATVLDRKEETYVHQIHEDLIRTTHNDAWRRWLASATANLYYCKYYNWTFADGKKGRMWAGADHNRAVAIEMFHYLEKTVVRLSREYADDPTWRYEFAKGCGYGLATRINKMVVERSQPHTGVGNALPMVIEQAKAQIEKYMAEKHKIHQGRAHRKIQFGDAAWDGRLAADGISLNTQLNAAPAAPRLTD